jgi:uncharacterized caspase-like protein
VALVIGNGAYATLPQLKNPGNDATDVAMALKGVGFNVTQATDAGRASMIEVVNGFLKGARSADVSLFYYAGHGFQVDAENYLVPVDAVLRSVEDVNRATIKLDEILRGLEGSEGIHLVFLDACRNNPLAAAQTAVPRQDGLARVGHAAGFMIAFATQPDNVAYDGAGRNSSFAEAILGHLNTPGQDIASMMISVRKDVLAATGGRQVPWENSSLTREFQFEPGEPAAPPETLLWQVAATARDPALLRLYLERYPGGPHVADVRAFLDEARPSAADSVTGTSVANAMANSLWEVARRTRLRPLIEAYLDNNPDGTHAEEADRMLSDLPRLDDPDAGPELRCDRLATHPRDATANTAGVPLFELARHAKPAMEACRQAAAAHPETPHYTALLARATAAAGRRDEAIALYRDAADRGDVRAMVSLGLITATGDGVVKDPAAAAALYQRAAAGGSSDGAVNLAVALFRGTGIPRDLPRALELMNEAARDGSDVAAYNLGVFARDGVSGTTAMALDYFRQSTRLGEPRAYVAAAVLLDEGGDIPKDPSAAADLLLQGAAADDGQALSELTGNAAAWSPATIRAVQVRLKDASFYNGPLDGLSGPLLAAALQQWRRGGYIELGPPG